MFRQRFIADVDANAIVYDLEHQDIISDGDLKEVTRTPSGVEQNQFLHRCLKRKATEDTLLQVCDIMIGCHGNSRMNRVGKEMKSALETVVCERASDIPCVCVVLLEGVGCSKTFWFSRKGWMAPNSRHTRELFIVVRNVVYIFGNWYWK